MADNSTKYKVTNLTLTIRTGTERDVTATWAFNQSKEITKNLKEFKLNWQYYDPVIKGWRSDGYKNSEVINRSRRADDYTPPDSATKVRLQVQPIADDIDKKQDDGSTKKEPAWLGGWCSMAPSNNGLTLKAIPYQPPPSLKPFKIASENVINLQIRVANSAYVSIDDAIDSDKNNVDIVNRINCMTAELQEHSDSIAIDGYEYKWEYTTSTGSSQTWFPGDSNRIDEDEDIIMYSFPEVAKKLRFKFRAVPSVSGLFTQEFSNWSTVTLSSLTQKPVKRKAFGKYRKPKDTWTLDYTVGSSSTIRVTYDYKYKNDTASYNYNWYYQVNPYDPWTHGGAGSTNYKYFEFTPPPRNIINQIGFRITPIAKQAKDKYGGTYSLFTAPNSEVFSVFTKSLGKKIEKINKISNKVISVGLIKGQSSTVYAQWKDAYLSKESTPNNRIYTISHIAGFEYQWEYLLQGMDGNSWVEGESGTTTERVTTYSIEPGAQKIRFRVRAISTTYTDIYGDEVPYWEAEEFSIFVTYEVGKEYVAVPVLPTVDPDNPKKKIDIDKIYIVHEDGTERTLYGVINHSSISVAYGHIDHFDCVWEYAIKLGPNDTIWTATAVQTAEPAGSQHRTVVPSYTPPNAAFGVRLKVLPVSASYTDDFGREVNYWKYDTKNPNDYTDYCIYKLENLPPLAPSNAPDFRIEGTRAIATVSNYNSPTATKVEFEIVRDNTDIIVNGEAATVKLTTGYAQFIYNKITLGHMYKVRCLGRTDANLESEYTAYSNNVETGPQKPKNTVKAVAVGSNGMVRVSWEAVSNADTYVIQYAERQELFDISDVSSVETSSPVTQWQFSPGTGTKWWFRVAAKNAQGTSGYTKAVPCILAKQPQPPTTWSESTIVPLGDPVRFLWVHNAEDNSPEEQAQIVYYLSTSPSTARTISITDTVDEDTESDVVHNYTFATTSLNVDQTIRWKVRTKGASATWSDYSIEREVALYSAPTVTCNLPATISAFPITLNISAAPAAQTAISASVSIVSNDSYEDVDFTGENRLVVAGEQIFSRYITPSSNSFQTILLPTDVALHNGMSYTLFVTVAMDSGLNASVSKTFQVSFDYETVIPDGEVSLNYVSYSASIKPFCYNEEEVLADVTLSVFRREHDGSYVEIASGLENLGYLSVVDPHPSLEYARYRIIATSNVTGEVTYADILGGSFGVPGIIIQWGDEWDLVDPNMDDEGFRASPVNSRTLLHLPYNVDITDDHDPDVALIEYIGRANPVSYYGTQLGISSTWNTEIDANDKATLYALRRLARYQGDVYIRESSGIGYWAQVTVSYTKTHREVTIPVTFTIKKVEGGI